MEAGFVVLLVLTTIIGFVVGMIVGKKKERRLYLQDVQYTQGTLNVDCTDPEFGPGLFLGLAIPVKDVATRKYVALDVNVIMENSHE